MSMAQIQRAQSLARSGRTEEAMRLLEQVVQRQRSSLQAHALLADLCLASGRLERALEGYRTCARLRPRDPEFPFRCALALVRMSRPDEALARLDQALAIQATHRASVAWKASLLEVAGRYDEAEAVLDGFADEPDAEMDRVRARLALVRKNAPGCIAICERHLASAGLNDRLRAQFGFLLGQALDRMGRCDEAFDAFVRANQVGATGFDTDAFERWVRRVAEVTRALPELGTGDLGEGIVLICALPRGGTTLVESIIDAHPEGAGIGESDELDSASLLCAGSRGYPEGLVEPDGRRCEQVARELDRRMRARARSARVIANKNLRNWVHVGLARRLLPRARFIWVRREARDHCVGMFTQDLGGADMGFTRDLVSAARVWRLHEQIMSTWRGELGERMLEVCYEDLAREPEPIAREIIGFCGLAWDDACLRFHESRRAVLTHSAQQVREGIHSRRIGRWRRFEKHLGAMLEELGIADGGEDPC